ncbi:histone-lysine N-methyltransferase SETMAR-like protein [Plakobranchus ocellatus]|uniref:Histone-lysine N-methyltransferase SETMAR-like protein n=1 Tax=Plakobranchus ocellatus TaxID=259542 RepID=A0AAV4BDW7_9GAST|nr:histone-lysine N-methyltransferase SETMAR-like protein [Plakobranchus ocellatus]
MATSNDLLIKERSVIEFLAAEGCSTATIHARMKTFYGVDPRETILRDRKRSGRNLSALDTAHREKVDCMITANRRVTQKEIALGFRKNECTISSQLYWVTEKSLPVGSQDSSL